jgi:hypothetical protein
MQSRRLILSSVALSCVAASFPDYPVRPASEYANVLTKSGLVVAAIPMEDRQDQHKYFGMDLRSRGYVPVFLVIENQTPSNSVFVRKEGLMYSPAARSGSTLPNPANPRKADKALSVAAAVPTIFSVMATVMVSKSKEVRQNILKRELQTATLSPGASAHGFVFVPAHWQHSLRDKIQLTIPFALPESSETVIMDLAF